MKKLDLLPDKWKYPDLERILAQVKNWENSLTTKLLVTSYSCPAKKKKKLSFPAEIKAS